MNPVEIVVETFESHSIPFQKGDAYVNATKMCKVFGKIPYQFLRLPGTQAYLYAFAKNRHVSEKDLIRTHKGGDSTKTEAIGKNYQSPTQGTWIHPSLALLCAQWLSPDFAIWCNDVILNLLARAPLKNQLANPKEAPPRGDYAWVPGAFFISFEGFPILGYADSPNTNAHNYLHIKDIELATNTPKGTSLLGADNEYAPCLAIIQWGRKGNAKARRLADFLAHTLWVPDKDTNFYDWRNKLISSGLPIREAGKDAEKAQ
ncbi:MAG: KilA-N domain-containing protein [Chthoniobacteraceae bacterium]